MSGAAGPNPLFSDSTSVERHRELWHALDRLLRAAGPERAVLQGVGPLEAERRNRVGEPIPAALEIEARRAAFAMLSVQPLLRRIRDNCDGPLVLMKGPEIAIHYPGSARAFHDIDLLVPQPDRTHGQLREAGFAVAGDPDRFRPHHHLQPLKWPDLPLRVEIHGRPHWPEGLDAPAASSIIAASVLSTQGVEGILAPELPHHVLLVAAHAWAHEPLHRLRDLIDVRALAVSATREALEQTARSWGVTRLWRTTDRVTDAVLGWGRMPLHLRLWAGHLLELRERTVMQNHLRAWLAAYSALPISSALATTAHAVRDDVSRAPEERWAEKLARAVTASKNAGMPLSRHHRRLGEAATRGRTRNRRRGRGNDPTDAPRVAGVPSPLASELRRARPRPLPPPTIREVDTEAVIKSRLAA
jgi:hypothetical protein